MISGYWWLYSCHNIHFLKKTTRYMLIVLAVEVYPYQSCFKYVIIACITCILLLLCTSEDTECHTANGSDYNGTQSQIESSESERVESSSTPCVQWNETNSNYSTLPGNYCRYKYFLMFIRKIYMSHKL